jgi:signal transduction histidine kinase
MRLSSLEKLQLEGFQEIKDAIAFEAETAEIEKKSHLQSAPNSASLAEITQVLFESIDYESTLRKVAEGTIQSLADWCIFDALSETGDFRRVAVLHRDPAKAQLAEELERNYPPGDVRGVPSYVLRTRQPLLIPEVTDAHYASTARSPRHLELLKALGSYSYMCVPLFANDRFLGAITFVSSSPDRRFGNEDVLLASAFCEKAALAVDNSLLYKKAQRAIQLRDDMMNIVSHDLKNPLSAISLSLKLLQRHISKEGASEAVENSITNISRATERMKSLISDLLDLSKLASGGFEMQRSPFLAKRLIKEVVTLFEPIAADRNILIHIRCDESISVDGDFNRLFQVFQNFLENAVKFTPSGGSIQVSAEQRDEEVEFEVRDSGCGIPPEELPYLFERFWQGRASGIHQGQGKGSGLGLSIAKAIVEAHGGEIWAKNRPSPETGASFNFRIPCREAIEKRTQ